MSMNACSINGFTLHGKKCSDKFAALVPILHPTPITSGSSPRVLRDTHQWSQNFEIENKPNLTFEQSIVTVSVEILGFSESETQDVTTANLDFVTVTNFEVQSEASQDSISVNITDLTFG